jgi:hypothetical protein
MDLLLQLFSTFALILGIAAGENIATRAFGMLKRPAMYLIEVFLFVVSIVVVFSIFIIQFTNLSIIILFYSSLGFVLILGIRGVITLIGLISYHIREDVLKVKDNRDYMIGLKKSLERRAFEKEEIRRILIEAGFTADEVEPIFQKKKLS